MGPISALARSLDDRAVIGAGNTADDLLPRKAPTARYARYVKPALDRVLGTVLLILATPAIGISALLVLVRMGRPVFYRQVRVGKDGRRFEIYKLRTMIQDRRRRAIGFDGPDRRLVHKSENDPRVTGLGRRLRLLRLDELPQLWNVVIGDMSLVGPRPELVDIVETYAPWQHERHDVKPGLTGLWQVSRHNGTPMHECTEIDLAYTRDITLFGDLAILLLTPIAMLGRRGGY